MNAYSLYYEDKSLVCITLDNFILHSNSKVNILNLFM